MNHTGSLISRCFFDFAMRALKWCDRIGYLGLNQPLDMAILLFDYNFLTSRPVWSQDIEKPNIKNSTLMYDF